MPRFLPHLFILALLCLLCLPAAAQAHKVNVFAYVDGQNLVLDCFFSKSDKVNKGVISVQDADTGEVLARAVTDEHGALTLPVPPKALVTGHDLKILLMAGEGHQSETLVRASEFAGLKAATPVKPTAHAESKAKTEAKSGAKPAAPGAAPAAVAAPLDEATLTRIVEQAVDSRMAPVKRLLMESAAPKGPGIVEILGGIGYIFGLFGIAALVASRRKDRPGT